MATKGTSSDHKVSDTGELLERGHATWKRDKVARGLAKAKDRECDPSKKCLAQLQF